MIIRVDGPANDINLNTKNKFWEEVGKCLEGFRNERIIFLGYVNGKVGKVR